MKTKGRIHSYEVGSTVDGPGLRFVVFTQGCPLRCLYCHNPDTRDPHGGREVEVGELLHEIEKYHAYTDGGHGGVTITGGEPLLQSEFVGSLLKACKDKGFHTTLDTSGFASLASAEHVLPYVDLVLLDIKSWIKGTYESLTQVHLQPTLDFAALLCQKEIPMWLRFVLVPGLTDGEDNVLGVAQFCASLKNLQRVEILPFHKLGEYKWDQLGLNYQLGQIKPATTLDVERARELFKKHLSCQVY